MPQDNTQITQNNSQATTDTSLPSDGADLGVPAVPLEPASSMPTPVVPVASDAVAAPAAPVASDVVVTPGAEPTETETTVDTGKEDIRSDVAVKISENKNVLIALSSDPSVDELSAAIGLSLYLDRIDKRATAIYSGSTPNTLEFLKPEETFESTADTLQDFVIAINKEKADHLRYKLDGDYVKVYITPYKHRLSQDDLEYSYGDYNVDLVIALDVANGIDLDSALREHGRIMHDASIINVTTGNPGKFGEIEWSDKSASSVSEMIAKLLYDYGGDDPIAKDEATAFLTGVVAATNRFSNSRTTSETMRLSSRLMESGANQVLVSRNITPDTENEIFNTGARTSIPDGVGEEAQERKETDPTKLEVEHDSDDKVDEAVQPAGSADETTEINADVTKKERTLLDDLKAAEESLSQAGAETTPMAENEALKIENGAIAPSNENTLMEPVLPEAVMPENVDGNGAVQPESVAPAEPVMPGAVATEPVAPEPVATEPVASQPMAPEPVATEPVASQPMAPEPVATESTPEPAPAEIAPAEDNSEFKLPAMPGTETAEVSGQDTSDIGAPAVGLSDKPEMVIAPTAGFDANSMTDDANKYGQMLQDALNSVSGPTEPSGPIMSDPADGTDNPAASGAPAVPATPEINGVPEMNYAPTPGTEILPPPPTPPAFDLPQNMSPAGGQAVMPSDPGAFQIPSA